MTGFEWGTAVECSAVNPSADNMTKSHSDEGSAMTQWVNPNDYSALWAEMKLEFLALLAKRVGPCRQQEWMADPLRRNHG